MEYLPTVAYGLKSLDQKTFGQAAFWKLATFSYLAANSGCFTFKLFLNYSIEPIAVNRLQSAKQTCAANYADFLWRVWFSSHFEFRSFARAARSVKNSRFGSSFFTPGGRRVKTTWCRYSWRNSLIGKKPTSFSAKSYLAEIIAPSKVPKQRITARLHCSVGFMSINHGIYSEVHSQIERCWTVS